LTRVEAGFKFVGTQLFDVSASNNEVIRFGDRYEFTLGLYLLLLFIYNSKSTSPKFENFVISCSYAHQISNKIFLFKLCRLLCARFTDWHALHVVGISVTGAT